MLQDAQIAQKLAVLVLLFRSVEITLARCELENVLDERTCERELRVGRSRFRHLEIGKYDHASEVQTRFRVEDVEVALFQAFGLIQPIRGDLLVATNALAFVFVVDEHKRHRWVGARLANAASRVAPGPV